MAPGASGHGPAPTQSDAPPPVGWLTTAQAGQRIGCTAADVASVVKDGDMVGLGLAYLRVTPARNGVPHRNYFVDPDRGVSFVRERVSFDLCDLTRRYSLDERDVRSLLEQSHLAGPETSVDGPRGTALRPEAVPVLDAVVSSLVRRLSEEPGCSMTLRDAVAANMTPTIGDMLDADPDPELRRTVPRLSLGACASCESKLDDIAAAVGSLDTDLLDYKDRAIARLEGQVAYLKARLDAGTGGTAPDGKKGRRKKGGKGRKKKRG